MRAMENPKLPDGMHVIVRDWLNSNQVILASSDANIVIDSGYGSHAATTAVLLERQPALAAGHLDKLVNTHCHSDHMGGNAHLRRAFGCTISIPAGEAPAIDRWDERELWLSYTDQRCERFEFDDVIRPGDEFEWAGRGWRALAAPGHDMHAVMF